MVEREGERGTGIEEREKKIERETGAVKRERGGGEREREGEKEKNYKHKKIHEILSCRASLRGTK